MTSGSLIKRAVSVLPRTLQNEMRRVRCARQIKAGTFVTDEAEFRELDSWVSPGDWVLDIGANVGHYTLELSNLVGRSGRVFAFEPVPTTFELLAANVAKFPLQNVTLLNMAASDRTSVVGMEIPKFDTGLDNYYMANIVVGKAELSVATIAVDALTIEDKVTLVKIDAEGHELSVLRGMQRLIERCNPLLIVEDNSSELSEYLHQFGYQSRSIAGSSNRIYEISNPDSAH